MNTFMKLFEYVCNLLYKSGLPRQHLCQYILQIQESLALSLKYCTCQLISQAYFNLWLDKSYIYPILIKMIIDAVLSLQPREESHRQALDSCTPPRIGPVETQNTDCLTTPSPIMLVWEVKSQFGGLIQVPRNPPFSSFRATAKQLVQQTCVKPQD